MSDTAPSHTRARALERDPHYWYYGSAAVVFGVKNHAFNYLLLVFITKIVGLPAYLGSVALLAAIVWDAVSDLLLGHWSDKTKSKAGRRHPFMYASLLVVPFSFWALFNPLIDLNAYEEGSKFAYVLLFAVLTRTGTTLFEVPSVAQLPEFEQDYDRRNRWLTLRYAFGWYAGNGIHLVSFLLWVGAYGVASQTGYSLYAAWGAALIAASIVISSLGTQRYFSALPAPRGSFQLATIGKEIVEIFQSLKNPNFGALFLYGLPIGIASGMGQALYIFNTLYFFGFAERQIAFVAIFVALTPLIAYVLVPRLGRALGKKRAAMAAILANVVLFPLPYVLLLIGWWPPLGSLLSLGIFTFIIVVEVICGIVFGVLLDSMMADIVEESEIDTGRRSEGLFYSARSFGLKAMYGLGIAAAALIISFVGMEDFQSAADMGYEHRIQLALLFIPLYCALQFAGLYFVSRYRIERADHDANIATLKQRAP